MNIWELEFWGATRPLFKLLLTGAHTQGLASLASHRMHTRTHFLISDGKGSTLVKSNLGPMLLKVRTPFRQTP